MALRRRLSTVLPFRGLKGVAIQARQERLAPKAVTKADDLVCFIEA
jgi:hypothetical protein